MKVIKQVYRTVGVDKVREKTLPFLGLRHEEMKYEKLPAIRKLYKIYYLG